jgi:hypothetical protein
MVLLTARLHMKNAAPTMKAVEPAVEIRETKGNAGCKVR